MPGIGWCSFGTLGSPSWLRRAAFVFQLRWANAWKPWWRREPWSSCHWVRLIHQGPSEWGGKNKKTHNTTTKRYPGNAYLQTPRIEKPTPPPKCFRLDEELAGPSSFELLEDAFSKVDAARVRPPKLPLDLPSCSRSSRLVALLVFSFTFCGVVAACGVFFLAVFRIP